MKNGPSYFDAGTSTNKPVQGLNKNMVKKPKLFNIHFLFS
jgi:hypothetical protein